MKNELILKFDFEASHSLANYEAPHPHPWKLEVVISGTPREGMIADIVVLREKIEEIVLPLRSTFLNDNPHVTEGVRKFPTCETLTEFFVERLVSLMSRTFQPENPTIAVSSALVSIHSMDGAEQGAFRLTL